MKLIKPGETQLPEKWWIGQIAVCDTCHANAEIDESDKMRRYSGTMRTNCITPNCKGSLTVEIADVKAIKSSANRIVVSEPKSLMKTQLKVYLAARYGRREELSGYASLLESKGIKVTSRWLKGAEQETGNGEALGDEEAALIEGDSNDTRAVKLRAMCAHNDILDIAEADVVIAFTEPKCAPANRGGRHVEFGIAIATGKMLAVIGYRENIFHSLPEVAFYETWEDFWSSTVKYMVHAVMSAGM